MSLQPLKLPPGVLRSATPALSRGRYWDTNLVRWRGGALLPVGGWEKQTPANLGAPGRKLHAWRDTTEIARIAIATDATVQVLEGDTLLQLTPGDFVPAGALTLEGGYGMGLYGAGLYGTPRPAVDARLYFRPAMWSLDNYGSFLMALASSDGRLFQWSSGPVMTPIATAPTNNRAMLVTEERHVMLFGAGGVGYRVAWCDRENIDNWDFASITNTAGFFDLGLSGWIVNAVKVRGGILIFTDSGVWLGTYIGLPSIYGFQKIGEACSLFSPYSVATFSTGAVWLGREGFFVYDGGTVRPMPSDIIDYVFKTVDPAAGFSRIFAQGNGLFPEIWLFYPSVGSTECDRYVIWNWADKESWWGLGTLSRTAMLTAGVNAYPLLTTATGSILAHERGWLAEGLTRLGTVYAETGPLAVDNGGRTYSVVQGQLDTGLGPGATQFRAYCSYTPDGAEYAEGPYIPRDDGWLDLRFSARDARFRIEEITDDAWSIGEIRLDIAIAGER